MTSTSLPSSTLMLTQFDHNTTKMPTVGDANWFTTLSTILTVNSSTDLPNVRRSAAPSYNQPLSKETVYGIFILNGILSFVGFIGNMFVCMIIIRGRKMYTIANLFLMNLAIADICVLIISYPLWIIQSLTPGKWPFGPALCKIIPSISDAFYGVSLGCMTTISIHRYRMILHAMETQLTFFQAKIIIILIWFISLASISAPLYPVLKYFEGVKLKNVTVNGTLVRQEISFTMCRSIWPSWSYERACQVFLTIAWYILPLAIIFVTFLRIRYYLQKQMAYEWLKGSDHNVLIKKHIFGIRKALRMLAPVVIMFAVLMLPWNVLRMLSVFVKLGDIENNQIYLLLAGTMLVANSVINPFIYYIMSVEFRIEFRKQFWLLKKALGLGSRTNNDYTIQSDTNGRKYVRRMESILDSKTECNKKFTCSAPRLNTHLRANNNNYEHSQFSDYDEVFKEPRYVSLESCPQEIDGLFNSTFNRAAGVTPSTRTETSRLCSIAEEQDADLESKDSGFENGNLPSDKNLNLDTVNEGLVCETAKTFEKEAVVKETIL